MDASAKAIRFAGDVLRTPSSITAISSSGGLGAQAWGGGPGLVAGLFKPPRSARSRSPTSPAAQR